MIKLIFKTRWTFMRWLRMAMALTSFVFAYQFKDAFFALIGSFFLVQALFNWGCGSSGSECGI
jgi:hypothetical protein